MFRLVNFAHDALVRYIKEVRPKLMKNKQHQRLFVNMRGGELTARGVRYILNEMMENASHAFKNLSTYVTPYICYSFIK